MTAMTQAECDYFSHNVIDPNPGCQYTPFYVLFNWHYHLEKKTKNMLDTGILNKYFTTKLLNNVTYINEDIDQFTCNNPSIPPQDYCDIVGTVFLDFKLFKNCLKKILF